MTENTAGALFTARAKYLLAFLKNLLLFTGDRYPDILVVGSQYCLSGYSTNGNAALKVSIPDGPGYTALNHSGAPWEYTLTGDNAERIIEYLKGVKDTDRNPSFVTATRESGFIYLGDGTESLSLMAFADDHPVDTVLKITRDMFSGDFYGPPLCGIPYLLHPAVLRQVLRLDPMAGSKFAKMGAIDIFAFEHKNNPNCNLIDFKFGPYVRGIIADIRRDAYVKALEIDGISPAAVHTRRAVTLD